jgi:uncharacterized protein involved in oxidation of intracellular sulfur
MSGRRRSIGPGGFPEWRTAGHASRQTMLGGVTRRGGIVGVCGTRMDARGIIEAERSEGTRRSTLDELTAWTLEADKVLVF